MTAAAHRPPQPIARLFAGNDARGTHPIRVDPGTHQLWERLEPLSYSEQIAAVESDGTYHTPTFCQRLLQLALVASTLNARIGVQLGNLAVRVCGHLSRKDEQEVCDLRALCLAVVGHARGALGELQSAGDAFDEAATALAAGTGDTAVEAELVTLEALLRCKELRFGDAVTLLDRMLEICTGGREAAELAPSGKSGYTESLVVKGWCLYRMGQAAAGLSVLGEAEREIDRGDPEQAAVLLRIRTGCAWCALALSDLATAQRALGSAATLARRLEDQAARLRLHQAEARLELAQGKRRSAGTRLRRAATGLAQLKLGIDAALVLLDLVALEEGASEDLVALAYREILPTVELGEPRLFYQLLIQSLVFAGGRLKPNAVESFGAALAAALQPGSQWWSAWVLAPKEEATGGAPARARAN